MIELSVFTKLVDQFYPPEHFPKHDDSILSREEMAAILAPPDGSSESEQIAHYSHGWTKVDKLIESRHSTIRKEAIFSLRSSCLLAMLAPERTLPRRPTQSHIKDLRAASAKLATIRRDLENLPESLRDVANMLGVAQSRLDMEGHGYIDTETALSVLEKHFNFISRWTEKQVNSDYLSASANRTAILIARAAVTLQHRLAPELPAYGTHNMNIPTIQEFTEKLFELCRVQASVADVLRDHCKHVYWIDGEIGFN